MTSRFAASGLILVGTYTRTGTIFDSRHRNTGVFVKKLTVRNVHSGGGLYRRHRRGVSPTDGQAVEARAELQLPGLWGGTGG